MSKFTSIIKILYANVNSYIPKKHIINNIIEKNHINCTLFVETKTKNTSNTKYKNWDVLQIDGNIVNNNVRGGNLVQIHPGLKMRKDNPPRINNPLCEATHFTIPFLEDKLHIFLVYIHPTANIEQTIFTKAALYKYCVIIGDFNVNRNKQKQLNNFLENSTFSKANTPPTFHMANNPDTTPDILLYTNNLKNNIEKIETHPDIGSDHSAIEISINLNRKIENQEEKINNYNKCNMEEVNNTMTKYIEDIQYVPMNKDTIRQFNEKLTKTIMENTPKEQVKYYTYKLPPYIIRMIKNKRKMYRDYLNNPNEDYKRHINNYNKDIQKLIRQYKENNWMETCNEINKQQGKNYWQQIKRMTQYKPHQKLPVLEKNNKTYNTDQEKVQLFAEHFRETYMENNNPQFDDVQYEDVNNWYETYFSENLVPDTKEIDEKTYFEILYKGKNTAPGHDNITKNIIRKLNYEIHLYIKKIYEYCLNHSYFPPEWKHGILITIPKPNTDHTNVNNYRPITLLSVVGKNFEKIIKTTLHNEVGHVIPGYQFGFREKCSTIHPLTIITSNIQTAKLGGQCSAAIFLDIHKAFDSVWHRGILYKLMLTNCPKGLLFLLKDFLSARTVQVKINNNFSQNITIQQGVPQGSPLSPFLYNIYCHDIYNFNLDPEYLNLNSYILQYADDTALVCHNKNISKTVEALQQLMNKTIIWFNKWRMKPNPLKSQYIVFNHKASPSTPTITIDNNTIYCQSEVKYLGVTIDNKLNFNKHVKLIKKKCITRSRHFRSLTYKNQGISKKTAAHIYTSICRPILEYSHPLYLNARRPVRKNLEIAETTTLRSITKTRHPRNPLHNPPNTLLYEITQITPINQRLKSLTTKFAKEEHNIEIIQPLCKIRDQGIPRRRKYPELSLWENITSLNNLL